MNQDKAIGLARAAGASGRSYSDFCCSDEWAAAVDEIDASGGDVDSRTFEAAYCEGRREWRLAGGWKTAWTTAPADYDGFGTETAEGPIEWKGRRLRRVLIDPAFFSWQTGRYGSGGHGDWDEDPRVAEAKRAETLAREKAERETYEKRRADGLAWIRAIEDALLEADSAEEEARARGLDWKDVRAERGRRVEEKVAAERAAKWANCRAAFRDGDTLVDDGAPSKPGSFGYRIPAREAAVWHSVKVKQHYDLRHRDDADEAMVLSEDNVIAGSLTMVAARIAKGEVRVAGPEEHFPPRAVIARLGVSWKDILRVDAKGAVAWIGRPTFSRDPMVLNELGHVVRKKAVADAAIVAYREKMFGDT